MLAKSATLQQYVEFLQKNCTQIHALWSIEYVGLSVVEIRYLELTNVGRL